MAPEVVKRRGRKRKRKNSEGADTTVKKTAAGTRSQVFIGRYVKKEFDESGVFFGKIVSYHSGLYTINYEDGDCEDLQTREVKAILVGDSEMDDSFYKRKKYLDKYITKKYAKYEAVHSKGAANKVELVNNGAQDEVNSEPTSEDSDFEQSAEVAEVERPSVPPPQLPPSSGNFGIPEEHISHLLSVYSFLRSFSVRLFLSPFGLDEFVGALNSSSPNTLMDAIHVALIRALKSHVEILSSEGSELASKCFRSLGWNLLDSLTWPVFIVQYLATMRYAEGPKWKDFYFNVLERNYHTLTAGQKLTVLQLLCDDASNSAELRAEIDMREASEVGPDPDEVLVVNDENTPRRGGDFDEDGNGDECRLCGMDGTLLCCDGCPLTYHSRCIGVMKMFISEGEWFCPECIINKNGPIVTRTTSLRGAEFFGIDPYEQVFLGSCNHLLVMEASRSSVPFVRYYSPVDIQKVLHALTCSDEYKTLYSEIIKGILQYWEIPDFIGINNNIPNNSLFPKEISNTPDVINTGNINSVTEENRKELSGNMMNLPLVFQSCEEKSYMGSSFKPQVYINVYIHGDFAASAAASLAILSSEEKTTAQSQPSSNHKKIMSANYSLQTKAFSLVAKRFYWPNYEKKLLEASRERCGWCLSCKASINSKKGCLLNAAASNAIKSAAKTLACLRQSKNVDGGLASIASYVMFLEESLCGLTVGLFLNGNYRNQWRKRVEEAASLGEIKAYLLELERNIRDIAFSADWMKLVDDTGFENQVTQNAKNVVGSTQKRGPGRRGRKPSIIISEIPEINAKDLSNDVAWWRGGMLSKHVFQKGVLPHMMIKNAARQGGRRKINGVQYVDGLEVPKRSRQFLWRAAVDMSKTTSQLALQVRYLDLHMRWNELIFPEQPLHQDGKLPEAEASAFRNACIVDKKKISENKISYGVVFENQKHIPSRILKKIFQVEETRDKKEKNWFLETHVPLYLVKDYETKMTETSMPTAVKHVTTLSNLHKKELKASRENVFHFLLQKRDNMGTCLCTLCQLNVSFRVAARCSVCQGYCHEQCAAGSNIQISGRLEFLITCKRCHIEKEIPLQNETVADSPTSPLLLQGQQSQHPKTVVKSAKQNGYVKPLDYSNQPKKGKIGKKLTNNSNIIKGSKKKNKLCLGLIWRKKNQDDTGIDFRLNNLLLKNNPNGHLLAPKCHLCSMAYNSDLMYIRCNKCDKWFHADSVELHESKIMELCGFKCCRCRRIRTPICPYMDPEDRKKLEAKKAALTMGQKNKNLGSDFNSDSEVNDSELDASEEPVNLQEYPFHPFPTVDQVNNHKLEVGPVFDSEEPVILQEYPFHSLPTVDQVNHHKLEVGPVFYSEEPVSLQEYPFHSFPTVHKVNNHKHEAGTVFDSEEPVNLQEYPFRPFSTVDQVNDHKLEVGNGTVSKKLPVRKHMKSDVSTDCSGNIRNLPEESSTVAELDVSKNGFEDDLMFTYEDMEFEPQTYFSFNELLASDDGINRDPHMVKDDLTPEEYKTEPVLSVESGLNIVPCNVCSQTNPCPDLFCQTCGLWIHRDCSMWDEDSSWEPKTGWKCGNCRDWC